LECFVAERAVIPHAQLPAETQHRERRPMITNAAVARLVACVFDFVEKSGDLARKHALAL
jgi:hypothetical protein